jgi:multicomponent Na+:H+ antiporter subunit E
MRSLGMNLAVAVMWLLLSAVPSVGALGIGFVVGFALLAVFQSVVGSRNYVRRVLAFVRFLGRFSLEFVIANLKVAWAVLFRSRESLHPDFVTYDVTGLTRTEILLLSYGVSLTPGTTTVEISEDFTTLTFHALDADAPDAIRDRIDRTMKSWILSFTR